MSKLLFINKNAQSGSFAHSTEASEKASINVHAQRGRKHVRRDRMPILLASGRPKLLEFQRKHTASREGVGGKTEPSAEEEEQLLRKMQEEKMRRHHQKSSLATVVRAGGQTFDPFNTCCIKIDGDVHTLLRFYSTVFHPNTWHAEANMQSRSRGKYTFAKGAKDMVLGCLQDEMDMYCILAAMASHLQVFHKVHMRRDVDQYMSKALVATKSRIEARQHASGDTAVIDGRMIMNIYLLGVCEWYRMEFDASYIHLKAVRQMVDCIGGLRKLDRQFGEMLLVGDTYLAAERLAKPTLNASDLDPGKIAAISSWQHQHAFNPSGEPGWRSGALGYELTSDRHKDIVPDELRQIAEDLAEYISVLVLSRQQPDAPWETAHWVHLRSLTVRSRLLALDITDSRTKALRLAMLMWELMVMTVSARKRTIKLLAPRLIEFVSSIKSWSGHELVLCWILTVGCMSAFSGTAVEQWFMEEIVKLVTSGQVKLDLTNEIALKDFSTKFFYLDSIQAPMVQGLASQGAIYLQRAHPVLIRVTPLIPLTTQDTGAGSR